MSVFSSPMRSRLSSLLAALRSAARGWRPARWLHRAALFVTLAVTAHLLTVLLVPRYAELDAASTLINAGLEGKADPVPSTGEGARIIDADPGAAMAVCGFDLVEGPLRVTARTGFAPMALSVHMRGGSVIYAVTDRAAQRGALEFVLVTREQYEERVSRDDEGEGQRELRVVAQGLQGVVLARALVRQPSDRPHAEALVRDMSCVAAD